MIGFLLFFRQTIRLFRAIRHGPERILYESRRTHGVSDPTYHLHLGGVGEAGDQRREKFIPHIRQLNGGRRCHRLQGEEKGTWKRKRYRSARNGREKNEFPGEVSPQQVSRGQPRV